MLQISLRHENIFRRVCAELYTCGALYGDGGREAGPGGAQHLQPHVRVRPRAHIPGGHGDTAL